MRPVAPYVGIAVAVAIGVALAPYLGWIVVGVVLFLAFCVAYTLVVRGVRRLTGRLRQAFQRWADRTLV
jgi:ascorbate-specific PTS system EIIC-type component UlaA